MSSVNKKRTVWMLTRMCAALLVLLLTTCVACQADEKNSGKTEALQTNTHGYSLAPDIELVDQRGQAHRLSDYRGKIVYLTFWATWHEYCSAEMADVEQLYLDRAQNLGDVVVLGVVYPSEVAMDDEAEEGKREKTVEEMKQFLLENNVTFPVLFDVGGKSFTEYAITGLPTTYLIDREGFFIGVIPASIDKGLMDHFIEEALNGRHE